MEGAKYPKYENKLCYGIKIDIIDEIAINPLEISVSILKIIYNHHPDFFSFNNNEFIANLYGDANLKKNILDQYSLKNLMDLWQKDSKYFEVKRKPYLLY